MPRAVRRAKGQAGPSRSTARGQRRATPRIAPPGVVGLGLCVVDRVFLVDDGQLSAVRTRYRDTLVSPGGNTATAVAQAARLGCSAQLLSLVGDDAEGRWLLRALRALGVSTRRVIRSDALQTSTAVVLVDRRSGERRFIVPDRRALEVSVPAFDLSPIAKGRVLLVDGHFPAEVARAVRRARETGVPVIGDFNRPRSDWMKLMPYVDFPILPLEFAKSWGKGGPRETLAALERRFGGTPVLTLGKRGAVALHKGRVCRVPSPRVTVRDTTGAGDAFHGAFAAGLCRGMEVEEALGLAARAGAASCTALGATAGLLTEDEL